MKNLNNYNNNSLSSHLRSPTTPPSLSRFPTPDSRLPTPDSLTKAL
ncbi:MAG: hypothetical protein F6K63_28970 [Moorea sp. SIO1G6]|nr:hypothetical protein [Moorena sp. SIO1G6]NET68207.1 hypothetical protein [Moorena sp. SIO1G6]